MAKSKASPKKQKYQVGQIVAIPLPDKRYAYGKVFNNFDIGVYDFLSEDVEPVEGVVKKKFLFYNAVTDRAVKNGDFIVIGEEPFPDEESAWAPPMASGVYPRRPTIGVLHIAHKGELWRARPEEAAGMDVRDFSQDAELFVDVVVDRLINKNHHDYRYQP